MTPVCRLSLDRAVGFFQRSCHAAYLVALRPYRVWAIAPVGWQSARMVLAAQGRVAASALPGFEDIKLGSDSVRIANPCSESTRCEIIRVPCLSELSFRAFTPRALCCSQSSE